MKHEISVALEVGAGETAGEAIPMVDIRAAGRIYESSRRRRNAMDILFNNPQLYVIDYPGHDALEILDKRNGRVGLLRGATADRLREEFREFLTKTHDDEEYADFLDSHDAILEHPVSLH
ncbi:MAG: DUF3567 family protein [Rhodocyclaceae bacterium]